MLSSFSSVPTSARFTAEIIEEDSTPATCEPLGSSLIKNRRAETSGTSIILRAKVDSLVALSDQVASPDSPAAILLSGSLCPVVGKQLFGTHTTFRDQLVQALLDPPDGRPQGTYPELDLGQHDDLGLSFTLLTTFYGYAQVSTTDQNHSLKDAALRAAGY